SNIAIDLKETLLETGQKAVFIISSDFTHFGPNYHYIPFSTDIKKNIYDLDRGAIELIKKRNPSAFLDYVNKHFITICGAIPIVLLLKSINVDKVLLEQYYTSGDVLDNYRNSVSYASFVFR
ncbi:MAG: AmmeMemoRadiSam system protein B, partial [Nanoarchaeota archaeon]|nr:AmmeMemoRadiSam system protein B [Nanoarchaeota archaeon]MBU1854404.1 AmmeMemoRadiSam system protein B [Nanoarchaeota archaeon]